MSATGSTQQILFPSSYLCECADRFIACKADQYLQYHKYKVGIKPDMDTVLKIDRMRRIVCEGNVGCVRTRFRNSKKNLIRSCHEKDVL